MSDTITLGAGIPPQRFSNKSQAGRLSKAPSFGATLARVVRGRAMTEDQKIEALEQALRECAEAALDRIEALEELLVECTGGLDRARWSRRPCGPYPPSARRGASCQHQKENRIMKELDLRRCEP